VENSDEWTVCWSWRFSQFRHMTTLSSEHRVNHLPGTYSMLMKSMLYSTLLEMQMEHGREQFKLMAAQYVLPKDVEAFKLAYEESKNRPVPDRLKYRAELDPMYRKRWLVKAQTHRGIRFFPGMEELPRILHNHSMVAEYIEPLLIGGYKFDMGIYATVTSIDPLRIYVYNIPKVRFCKLPYPDNLDENAKELSYIVTQYFMPTWQNPALRKYYEGRYPSMQEYPNDMEFLKTWMDENGLDGEQFEKEMMSHIIKIVTSNRHKFLDGLAYNREKWDGFEADASNFFEMWRFDFVVDDEGRTFITEANQSPNMIIYNFKDDNTTDYVLKQGVIYDLLSMVTAGSQPLPPLPDMDEDYCEQNCNANADTKSKKWNMACWKCEDWYDDDEQEVLHRAAIEFSNRGGYRLVYPEIEPTGQQPPFHRFLEEESDEDEANREYFASLESLGLATSDGAPMVCYDRVQCNNVGECVNGKCVCDAGYGGTICGDYDPENQQYQGFFKFESMTDLSPTRDAIVMGSVMVVVVGALVWIAWGRPLGNILLRRRKSDVHKV